MPIYWRESNPSATTASTADDLLNQVECGTSSDGKTKHAQNAKLGFTDSSKLPLALQSAFAFWSGSYDKITPPIYVGTNRIEYQRAGTTPQWCFNANRVWESPYSATTKTYYIHRIANGEVWIHTSASNPTSGTRLGVSGQNIRSFQLLLIGGGGGGAGAGGSLEHSGAGGAGGAAALCVVKLPEVGYATLQVGGRGVGGSNYGDGTAGGNSVLSVGGCTVTCAGGAGGKAKNSSPTNAPGGKRSYNRAVPNQVADADLYVSAAPSRDGGRGGAKNQSGSVEPDSTVAGPSTEYFNAPGGSGSSVAYVRRTGTSGGSSGGGGGGSSAGRTIEGPPTPHGGGNGGQGGVGAAGIDPGNGGGGGGVGILTNYRGGDGGCGYAAISY